MQPFLTAHNNVAILYWSYATPLCALVMILTRFAEYETKIGFDSVSSDLSWTDFPANFNKYGYFLGIEAKYHEASIEPFSS